MNIFLGGYHHVFFHVNHRQFVSRCKKNINLSRFTSLNGSQGWTNYFFWKCCFFHAFFFEIIRLNLGHFALIEFGHWGTFFVWFFVLVFCLHFYKSFGGNLDSTWIQSASGNQRFSLKNPWSCWMVEKSFEIPSQTGVGSSKFPGFSGWILLAPTSGRFPWSQSSIFKFKVWCHLRT